MDVLVGPADVGLRDSGGSRVEELPLGELYLPRFGEDSVDGLSSNGVIVSFAKDSSVGFGALNIALKSLPVTLSASAFSLDELTAPSLSKATPK